jgi:hypothetical protein
MLVGRQKTLYLREGSVEDLAIIVLCVLLAGLFSRLTSTPAEDKERSKKLLWSNVFYRTERQKPLRFRVRKLPK